MLLLSTNCQFVLLMVLLLRLAEISLCCRFSEQNIYGSKKCQDVYNWEQIGSRYNLSKQEFYRSYYVLHGGESNLL